MKLTRWFSFRGEYRDIAPPDSDSGLEGTGIPEVALFVAAGLRRVGVSVGEAADREGWAHDFEGEFEGLPFESFGGSERLTEECSRPIVIPR